MSVLFSPIRLRSLTLPNRIVVSPMCQYMAEEGRATAWHLIHLGNMALSGAGLLCIEATAVEAEGRITVRDLGLWNDVAESALRPVLSAIRQYSRVSVFIQLAHAGRKASSEVPWEGGRLLPVSAGGWMPVAPSALPQKSGEPPPAALDAAGMQRIRAAFAASARRAMRLGLDGIEIHSAHGYLLHEFLSPIANHRTDQYGGSLESRMRFPLEVFDAVRAEVPADKPVGVKVSATDWVDGGWDVEQTIAFARELKQRGVDWITVSSGGISPLQKISLGPGYQIPFAEAVKQATGINTVAVGLITRAQQAEQLLERGQADQIALARAMLYEPRWGWHAAAELGATIDDAPPSYWRAVPHEHSGLFRHATHGAR